jgi:hypothetical protein
MLKSNLKTTKENNYKEKIREEYKNTKKDAMEQLKFHKDSIKKIEALLKDLSEEKVYVKQEIENQISDIENAIKEHTFVLEAIKGVK